MCLAEATGRNVVGQQSAAHNGTCCVVSWEQLGRGTLPLLWPRIIIPLWGAPWPWLPQNHSMGAEKVFHWVLIEEMMPP